MKTYLSILVVLLLFLTSTAQNRTYTVRDRYLNKTVKKADQQMIFAESNTLNIPTEFNTAVHKKGNSNITVIPIGTAANAYGYGYAGGQRTILWIDPELDIFVNLHRETHSTYSGNLAIDITYDRGLTFEKNIRVYESTMQGGQYNLDAARYPQGGIYNPPGNTDPQSAYFTFFAPTLDGSNFNWGGYCFGSASLGAQNEKAKQLRTSGDGVYQYIPNGFTITSQKVAWSVDLNQRWYGDELVDYRGHIILNKGLWNNAANDYDYEEFLFDFPTVVSDLPPDIKIAFAPDGETGYIVALADDGSVPFSRGAYYPVVYKTTDGGDTWYYYGGIQLGGINGIKSIVYDWLSDDDIYWFFYDPIPYREEILYTTAFDFDLVVDANGNPHIAVVVGICDGDYAIYIPEYYFAVFDIFSFDGGDTWNAHHLQDLRTLRGYFGAEVTEDNRVNASVSPDGSKVFISWLDTYYNGWEDNNYPDIFCIGIDPLKQKLTPVVNVTEYSDAWAQAYFFVAPQYIFVDGNTYNIPFTYENMNPGDPEQQVTFMYIRDFTFGKNDFMITGVDDIPPDPDYLDISAIYPNPAKDVTRITIEISDKSKLLLEVYDMFGHRVIEKSLGEMIVKKHEFDLNLASLSSGIYTLRISDGVSSDTEKLIVN